MENTSINTPPKPKKKINDFVWLFIGIAGFILALVLLRMFMQQMNLIQ